LYDDSPDNQQNEDEDDQMSDEEDYYDDMLCEVSNERRWNEDHHGWNDYFLKRQCNQVSIEDQWNENLHEDHDHGWNLHEDLWNALPDETFEQFYSCFPISSLKRVCHMMHIYLTSLTQFNSYACFKNVLHRQSITTW
jgi:hypothetical protein